MNWAIIERLVTRFGPPKIPKSPNGPLWNQNKVKNGSKQIILDHLVQSSKWFSHCEALRKWCCKCHKGLTMRLLELPFRKQQHQQRSYKDTPNHFCECNKTNDLVCLLFGVLVP